MKTYSFTSKQGFSTTAVADLNVVVINKRDKVIFAEFSVYFSQEAMTEGAEPIDTIKLSITGDAYEAVKTSPDGSGLWRAIERAAFSLGANLFPADAQDVQ